MTSIPEKRLTPAVAESWIRDALVLHPLGAQLTVSGACMEPAIPEGSTITLTAPIAPPRAGDVVLLQTPNGLRLHRILIRFRGWMRTKGDQGAYLDPPGSPHSIIAACPGSESRAQRLGRVGLSAARLFLRFWRKKDVKVLDLR